MKKNSRPYSEYSWAYHTEYRYLQAWRMSYPIGTLGPTFHQQHTFNMNSFDHYVNQTPFRCNKRHIKIRKKINNISVKELANYNQASINFWKVAIGLNDAKCLPSPSLIVWLVRWGVCIASFTNLEVENNPRFLWTFIKWISLLGCHYGQFSVF